MAVMVVTRLRLGDPALFDEFFAAAVAVAEQATATEGCLGERALADADNVYWTVTGWEDRDVLTGFVGAEPHRTTMARLDEWCDEATFVDWEQTAPELPGWKTCYDHLVKDGQAATLAGATAASADARVPDAGGVLLSTAPRWGAPPLLVTGAASIRPPGRRSERPG